MILVHHNSHSNLWLHVLYFCIPMWDMFCESMWSYVSPPYHNFRHRILVAYHRCTQCPSQARCIAKFGIESSAC